MLIKTSNINCVFFKGLGYASPGCTSLTCGQRTGYSTTCTASTCGQNAQCSVIGGRPVCSCLRGHTGDPLSYCRR